MVGICTLLIALGAVVRSSGGESGTSRRRAGSCAPRPSPGIAAVVALESGWIVTEVGRQPWIVYDVMRTRDAVTQATARGDLLRSSLSTSRSARCSCSRFEGCAALARRGRGDDEVPYGPYRPVPTSFEVRCMSTADPSRSSCCVGVTLTRCSAVPTSAPVLDPDAGGGGRGPRAARLIDRAIGPVWEANHVWLIFVLVLIWTAFPLAFARSSRRSSFRSGWPRSVSCCAAPGFAFRQAVDSAGRGAWPPLRPASVLTPFFFGTVPARSLPGGCPPAIAAGDALTSRVNPTWRYRRAAGGGERVPGGGLPRQRRAPRRRRPCSSPTSRVRALVAAVVTGPLALVGLVVLRRRRARPLRRPAWRRRSRSCSSGRVRPGARSFCWGQRPPRGARPLAARALAGRDLRLGRRAVPGPPGTHPRRSTGRRRPRRR